MLNAMLDIKLLCSISCYTTTMGVATGTLWTWSPKPISRKGRTRVEWAWWYHRNAKNKGLPPQSRSLICTTRPN